MVGADRREAALALVGPNHVSLAEASEGRLNNFDAIRLVAAGLVLVYHSFALTEPIHPPLGHFGLWGVEIFFVISGLLVVKSWVFDPRLSVFAAKRSLRIFPALWVCVLVTVFVVGPLFTTLGPGEYLTRPRTWLYLVSNLTQLRATSTLPGVFSTNPYPAAVNGSLWTLPIEMAAYVGVAVAGLLGVIRHPKLVTAVFALLIVHEALWPNSHKVSYFFDRHLFVFFAAGASLFVWRTAIPLRIDVMVALLAVATIASETRFEQAATAIALPYTVMFVAFRTPHISFRRIGDLSYGTYIYAFPVQQAIIATTHTASPLTVLVLATPITLTLAFASWRRIERLSAAPNAPAARDGDGRGHIRNSRTRRSEIETHAPHPSRDHPCLERRLSAIAVSPPSDTARKLTR